MLFTQAQEKLVPVVSKITNVTVFMKGAQVERNTESIEIPQGVTEFVFSGLSSAIETQSIQARGEGNFTILSVVQQPNFLAQRKNSEQKEKYMKILADLNDQIAALRNESAVYKEDEQMLLKNNYLVGPNVNYDLAKLKQALDFQKQRLAEAKAKQLEIGKLIEQLQLQLTSYQKQLMEIGGKTPENTSDIVLKVSSGVVTKGKLTLTYVVQGASWYPTYDIRAKDISSPVELVYKANVSQNSGEDWKNIKLTLSSGNPSVNNVKPILSAYHLGFVSDGYSVQQFDDHISRIATGRVFNRGDHLHLPGVSVRVKNSSVATFTDANGRFNLQIPDGAKTLIFSYVGFDNVELPVGYGEMNVAMSPSLLALNEVVVSAAGEADFKQPLAGRLAGVQVSRKTELKTAAVVVESLEKPTNVTFEIKNPYTILSDGKQFSVDIGNFDLKADFEYFSVPKISEEAFLTAKINDFGAIHLLSGEANIFFEGTFLGKTLIDLKNASDTLAVSLGADKNVIVKREKQKDFNEKQFIGSSQRDNRSFVIDVKNRKGQAINVIVEDQIPVSTTSDISVERQEVTQAKYNEETGKLQWKMVLQPNEQRKLILKYQVKYPKNKPINLE